MNLRCKLLIFSILIVVIGFFTNIPAAYGAKQESSPYTIVIDAGHGGKETGVTSNGVSEKDVTLAVATKLGEFIKKNLKGVNVVFTRAKDEYVSLQQRADATTAAKADLLVSLHVSSADASDSRRASLSGAKVHIPDSMVRTEALAPEILKQLKDLAGRKSKGIDNEVPWLVKTVGVPAVMVELDYICNPSAAKFLESKTGQNKLAKALFNAIRTHYVKDLAWLASQPKEEIEPEIHTDGITYVGDGFAILSAPKSPERKESATKAVFNDRRMPGNRRRSQAGRQASADNIRIQQDVVVRTYSEPMALSEQPRTATRRVASASPTKEPQKTPETTTPKQKKVPAKNAKVNTKKSVTASKPKAEPKPTVAQKPAKESKPSVTQKPANDKVPPVKQTAQKQTAQKKDKEPKTTKESKTIVQSKPTAQTQPTVQQPAAGNGKKPRLNRTSH